MKTTFLTTTEESAFRKCALILIAFALYFFSVTSTCAQAVLFDFDNAPLYTPFPIDQTVSGITAHFSATGPGYSIQGVGTAPVVPVGFTGHFIYPSSINLSDLLISFDQTLTDFSIKYSPQELACDTSARMRVTAYMNGSFVGTNTMIARVPGTWPVDTLSCSFPQGFDSVVVHYDSTPFPCQDYGVIFLADNMRVTALDPAAILNPRIFVDGLIVPNPISQSTNISFSLLQSENINVSVYDVTGRIIINLFDGHLINGEHKLNWNVDGDAVEGGVYFLHLTGRNFSISHKLVVVK